MESWFKSIIRRLQYSEKEIHFQDEIQKLIDKLNAEGRTWEAYQMGEGLWSRKLGKRRF